MKGIFLAAVMLLLCCAVPVSGQINQLPWSAQSSGGGVSSGNGWVLTATVGEAFGGTSSGTNFAIEGGFLPGMRTLSGTTALTEVSVQGSWNLVSVPLLTKDPRKTAIFPSAVSNAFAYYAPPVGYTAVTDSQIYSLISLWSPHRFKNR